MNHNVYVVLSFLPEVKEVGSQVVRRSKRGWFNSVVDAIGEVFTGVVDTLVELTCMIPGIDDLCRPDSRDNRVPPGKSLSLR